MYELYRTSEIKLDFNFRWALIAGRIPGRTANDVKNYWNTHLKSRPKQDKEQLKDGEPSKHTMVTVIKPQPHTISKALKVYPHITSHDTHNLITSSNVDGSNNAFNISPDVVSSPMLSLKEIGDEVGWSFSGFSTEGNGLDLAAQIDGQNGLFDFSIDDVVMLDLLDGEQL
ncbi:putative transcription factor MYB-HB-like family [Helianthus annuus]|uniref:Transcription factor MYB-related family n=1 Tax=Helianthus annuus TaxID=4232 RepID=A0A9K3ND20_HELAN|nr:putative transcription factor MYB-related family [Helianthus annuus]KAJ0539269.1 putative transcription factor MYB-HB-like family [Helianthus annuus]KAJ0547375.1 putative transcription factor MYB-HB-like family [Helianthus annuus]KAJ0553928.1 putative transcription factor MYB-HB-like family [Helianthus annuus]KAJ0719571.1 putative transcription factor MYB-HB-like family [Helianthus annuus]